MKSACFTGGFPGSLPNLTPYSCGDLWATGRQPEALRYTGPLLNHPRTSTGGNQPHLIVWSLQIQYKQQPFVKCLWFLPGSPEQSKAVAHLDLHGALELTHPEAWHQTTTEHHLTSPISSTPKRQSQQVQEPAGANLTPWGQPHTAAHILWEWPIPTASQPKSQSHPLISYNKRTHNPHKEHTLCR